MTSERQPGRRIWLCVVCYSLLIATVIFSLFAARKSVLQSLSIEKSVSDWQSWREEVRQQQSNGAGAVVERRVPKSAEPPALVLLRDYFVVSLSGALLFSTVLYWIMAWLLLGALTTPPLTSRPASTRTGTRK